MSETAQTESARPTNYCFDFGVATFWQSLSKEIAQYHQPDSIVLLV